MDHDSRTMLLETADRFFTERCGKEVVNSVEKGVWPADRFVTIIGNTLAVIAKANTRVEAKPSHAGEPYGTVSFDNATAEFNGASPVSAGRALELAAVMRAMQMAGAADKVLATAVEYS